MIPRHPEYHDGGIIAATIEKIVEEITSEYHSGEKDASATNAAPMKFNSPPPPPPLFNLKAHEFLLMVLRTYSTFCTSSELLHLLSIRYHVPPPIDPEFQELWRQYMRVYIQARVYNALRNWLDQETP